MSKIPADRRLSSGYLRSVEELNLGPPSTNSSSWREEDLNSGLPDYKSIPLATRIRCLLYKKKLTLAGVHLCNLRMLLVEFRDRSGEALKLLLERGFDPNVQHSSNSSTPLHLAVKKDNEMAVRILTQCPECNINLQVCFT